MLVTPQNVPLRDAFRYLCLNPVKSPLRMIKSDLELKNSNGSGNRIACNADKWINILFSIGLWFKMACQFRVPCTVKSEVRDLDQLASVKRLIIRMKFSS